MTERKIKYTPSGSRIQPTYTKGVEKGITKLIKTGTTDIYEKIQQYKDECDIKTILARCQAGDISVLNKTKGFYGDFSNLPKSLNELNMFNKSAEQKFMELPAEIREEFDQDYGKFAYELEKGTAGAKLEKYMKVEQVEQTAETQITKGEQTNG